jgi:D-amino-acid dehydrogenase
LPTNALGEHRRALYNVGMSANKPDVLILGGGVIGLACAHYLLQAGRSVHLLERNRVGAATSHGNCGTITPSHSPPLAAPGMVLKGLKYMFAPDAPLYIKPRVDLELAHWLLRFSLRCNRRDWHRTAIAKSTLLHTSRRLLESLVRDNQLDCEFAASGLHTVYRDAQTFANECAALPELSDFGIETKVLSPAELAADEPALKSGAVGAIHYPGDAHLRPDRYCEELARLVRSAGGVIEENLTVEGFVREGGRIVAVETSQGIREGRDVLLALGPWSPMLSKQLGLRLPIQPGKGYSITYSRPTLAPRRPIVLKERSVCVTTWADGFRLGSTMEFSGYDDSLNRTRLDALERAAREYLQQPTGPKKIEEWFGWRPMTYDDMPILGRAPAHENLWLATGHGMLGVTMSAVTGHLLADLICGREPIVDPSPSSPLRFA